MTSKHVSLLSYGSYLLALGIYLGKAHWWLKANVPFLDVVLGTALALVGLWLGLILIHCAFNKGHRPSKGEY